MASISGNWAGTAPKRAQLILTWNVPIPAVGDTSITVTGSVAIAVGNSINDSNNTFIVGGSLGTSFNGSKTINVATGGTQTLHTFSVPVALGASATIKTVTASLSKIEYIGINLTASVSANIAFPARRYLAPNTPWSITLASTGDNSRRVGWETSEPGDKPISSFTIERSAASTGKWEVVATGISRTARAWTDTKSMPNDRINYRVKAVGPGGTSGTAVSPNAWTTPAAPTNVLAVRQGATDVLLTWTTNARDAKTQDIQGQSSTDGGATWTSWANITGHTGLSPAVSARTITGLDSTRLRRFRIQAAVYVNGVSGSQLVGLSAVSPTLQLLTKPNPPTLVAPTGFNDVYEPIRFQLAKNHPDGSAITAVSWNYRAVGATVWSADQALSLEGWVETSALESLPSGQYEWRARTKGAHASWSDYSAPAPFSLAEPPSVSFAEPTPGQAVNSNRARAVLSVYDPQDAAVVSWTARLLDNTGQLLETTRGTGTGFVAAFKTPLTDLGEYSIEAVATTGTGLTSHWARVSFSTDFLDPQRPELDAVWYKSEGVTRLGVTNFPGASSPPATADTVANRLERSEDGGETWQVVAAGLQLDAGVIDWQAATNLDVLYRAVAISALGVEAIGDELLLRTDSPFAFIGQDGMVLPVPYNLQLGGQHAPHVTTHRFLGRRKRVAVYALDYDPDTTVTLQGVTLSYKQEDMFKAMLLKPVHYRDPAGRKFWAAITSALDWDPKTYGWADISITVEELDG